MANENLDDNYNNQAAGQNQQSGKKDALANPALSNPKDPKNSTLKDNIGKEDNADNASDA